MSFKTSNFVKLTQKINFQNDIITFHNISKIIFCLKSLGKKIWFHLIGLGKIFDPISPKCGKKVQGPPEFSYYVLASKLSCLWICLSIDS